MSQVQINIRVDPAIADAARVIAAAERQSVAAILTELLIQKIRETDSSRVSTIINNGRAA